MRTTILTATITAAMLAGTATAYADGHCATAEQTAEVQTFYSKPGPLPAMAAGRALQMSEVQILSGMSDDMAIGTTGEGFAPVWEQLATWDNAMVLVIKGGNVFEIHSTVPTGEPSTRSNYFNLNDGVPFDGHLRPDLLTSIYALEMPSTEGPTARGVFFFDASGESTFGVILAGEGVEPTEAEIAKFDALKDVIKSLPRACAGA